MPAAVARAANMNGALKNKKIVFNDDGEAEEAHPKENHNKSKKNSAHKTQLRDEEKAKKPHKIKFEDAENEEKPKKPKKIKFDETESEEKTKKSKKIKFDETESEEKTKKSKRIKFDETENEEKTKKSKKIKYDETDNEERTKKSKVRSDKKPQRITFDDEGEVLEPKEEEEADSGSEQEELHLGGAGNKSKDQIPRAGDIDPEKKWYQVLPASVEDEETLDMKDNEQMELYNACKTAFDAEKAAFNKRNRSDARWLQTALHKGTAKDRANSGALLVTSNPVGNLEALSMLIGFCKLSNKSCNEVIAVMTNLWKEVLLPPNRYLISLTARGAAWKKVKKQQLHKDQTRLIYAYWYFENELKDQYHEYLKNLMQGLQTGQEHNKKACIVSASHLLTYAPEKERMLLTMLVNKLGDPVAKIASKALHHLSEVGRRHRNMCGVIVTESEKLLFRNNISERAKHFALCFLASIAPSGNAEVCTKLVHICFDLFKMLVEQGAVNNRTMQAILRCLQKAIAVAKPAQGSTELLSKEMQDTIYRLVHLADIHVSVQTLGLLLQLVIAKSEKSDRFYNALYAKLLDPQLINIGNKTIAYLLHVVHRAMHMDQQLDRVYAFIKRLLQLALSSPTHTAAGCLSVLHTLLRTRKELASGLGDMEVQPALAPGSADAELDKFGSDNDEEQEVYKDADVKDDEVQEEEKQSKASEDEPKEEKPATSATSSSWHHVKLQSSTDGKVREIDACKYDPYNRVAAFAGAKYTLRHELLLLRQHYHPTIRVFAEQVMLAKPMTYYGDPLKDFSLAQFLERFSFKNPKNQDTQQALEGASSTAHKRYKPHGSRGKPIKSLTKDTCTEDELFILNYLEHIRGQKLIMEQQRERKTKLDTDEAQDDEDEDEYLLKSGEVDDDEFESYLNKISGGGEEEEINYLQEMGGDLQVKSKKKQKKKVDEDDDDDIDAMDDDWDDENDGEEDGNMYGKEKHSDDETGSIDLQPQDDDDGEDDVDDDDDNDDDDEADSISLNDDDSDSSEAPESPYEDDDEDGPSKSKKSRNDFMLNERGFAQKLKHSNDMSSLFAAADDYSALLEETGKVKGQGTSQAVFNKDKSSDKQLKWEEKRRSNSKNYTGKKFARSGAGGKMGPKGAKKKKY